MKTPLFIVSLFIYSLVHTLEDSPLSLLSSDNAVFDENTFCLSGHVTLRHELLLMEAEKANLFDYQKDSPTPFSQVQLEEDVILDFRNNTHLRCDTAFIDFHRLKGALESFNSPAIYTDLLGQQKIPIEIQGKQATFELLQGDPRYLSSCDLKKLSLSKEIFVKYGTDIRLQADSAIFQKFGEESSFSLRYIEALPENALSGLCRLFYQDNIVDASSIYIDLNTLSITMNNPHGIFHSPYLAHKKSSFCNFTADHLTWSRNWDNDTSLVTLTGNVSIQDEALGYLSSEEKISFHQVKDFQHFVIHSIHAYGLSHLSYLDKTSSDHQSLDCFEHLIFNRDSLSLKAFSPKNTSNLEKQNHYQNNHFSIYADSSCIEYQFQGLDCGLTPHEIIFKGCVRMISKETTRPLRYGLSDEILYYPMTQEILLIAHKNHKVLFWNEEANLKISADKILISIDPITRQECIKGLGKVLFAFNKEEEDNFHLLFPLYREHSNKEVSSGST